MNRLLFIVVFLGCFWMNGIAQKVIFDSIITDFGDVKKGSLEEATFVFTNVSDTNIKIKEVLPQCGCTSVSFSENDILPNQKGKLTLALDTSDKYGIDRKTVTVIFSDETQHVLVLKVNVID